MADERNSRIAVGAFHCQIAGLSQLCKQAADSAVYAEDDGGPGCCCRWLVNDQQPGDDLWFSFSGANSFLPPTESTTASVHHSCSCGASIVHCLMEWRIQQQSSLPPSAATGHGSQTPDRTGEERDGMSETILPCDFKTAGQLSDAQLNRLLINPLITVPSACIGSFRL